MLSRVVYKIWTDLSSIMSQITRLTDRQTDRRTTFSSQTASAFQPGKKRKQESYASSTLCMKRKPMNSLYYQLLRQRLSCNTAVCPHTKI